LNDINTLENNAKERDTNWEVYTPADDQPLPDSIKDAQKEAAKDPKASTQAAKDNWLKLWRECRKRNVAVMSGKHSFRPPALQPLGPAPAPLRPPEGYYASGFFVGAQGVVNFNSLGILEKDATNGVPKNGFGESSRAGGGGFTVGANTRIFSRIVLPDDASPRPVERVLLSFDFFNQDTSHVFPTTPQTFIGATSKFMVTGEVQLGINVVPGVQIYGIGGFSVLKHQFRWGSRHDTEQYDDRSHVWCRSGFPTPWKSGHIFRAVGTNAFRHDDAAAAPCRISTTISRIRATA
jgi:hypothetical protein